MRKLFTLCISYLVTLFAGFNLEVVQEKLIEKGALYLEEATKSPLFFHYEGNFVCRDVLFFDQHFDKVTLQLSPRHTFDILIDLQENSYLHLRGDKVEGIFESIPFSGHLAFDPSKKTISSSLELPTLNGKVDLAGPFQKMHLLATFDQEAQLTIEGIVGDPLHLKVEGIFLEKPFTIFGPMQLAEGQLTMEDLSLAWEEFIGSFHAIYSLKERILQTKGSLFAREFHQGFLKLNFSLLTSLSETFSPESPLLKIELESSLTEGEFNIDNLFAKISLEEVDDTYIGAISCNAKKCSYNNQQIHEVSFHWKWVEGELAPFQLIGTLDKPFLVTGSASLFDDQFRIFLEKIEGLPIQLEKGGTIAFDMQKGLIDGLKIGLGENHFGVFYKWESGHKQLTLDIPSLDLATLPFLPVKGRGNCLIKVEQNGDRMRGEVQGRAIGFEMGDGSYQPLFPLDGDIRVAFDDQWIDLQGSFFGPGAEEISLAGKVPFSFNDKDPITLHAEMKGEISPFLKSLLSETTLATGEAFCEIEVGGTVSKPQFFGTLTLNHGCYESLTLGCSFQELQGIFRLQRNELICERLEGRDRLGGSIGGQGKLILDEDLAFDFEITTHNVHLLHLDFANGLASGIVHFKGDKKGGLFEGDLFLDHLDIRLPDTTPSRLNALQVEYINQPKALPPPTLFPSSEKSWPLLLNLHLTLPNRSFVTGTQFGSEWSGKIDLQGSTKDPQLHGEIKLLRANFLLNGKNFTSNEGTIHFGRKMTLYMIAKHDIGDVEINVILKGPLREPEIAFRSNPPKSSREILSLILFNKGTGDVHLEENQELTRNLIKLSDQLASGPTLLDRFRSSLGIDRIDITATDSDEMSVSVGKYLTNRLFLSLKKSMDDQPNQASLEADLTNNFKAQAEVGDDAEARFMLKWEKDY